MKDINTIYREAVIAANAAQRVMLVEVSKTFTEATKAYLEDVEKASQLHLEAVSAAEIAWKAASEIKLAQFEGDDGTPIELPRIDPKELERFESYAREAKRERRGEAALPPVQLP